MLISTLFAMRASKIQDKERGRQGDMEIQFETD
jgi:hypothetical protein